MCLLISKFHCVQWSDASDNHTTLFLTIPHFLFQSIERRRRKICEDACLLRFNEIEVELTDHILPVSHSGLSKYPSQIGWYANATTNLLRILFRALNLTQSLWGMVSKTPPASGSYSSPVQLLIPCTGALYPPRSPQYNLRISVF